MTKTNLQTSQQTFVLMKTSWRRLSSLSSEDVLIKTNMFALALRLQKTSSRRLGQDQYIRLGYTSSRRLQDVFKTSSRRLAKTSSRHLQDVLPRRLQDVFKTSSRHVANTSWRHFQDVLKTYHQVKLFFLTSLLEVFSMFVRRTTKTVIYRIHLGHTS